MKNRREFYRKGLHEYYANHYDALCGILGAHWQPISGFRTTEMQSKLYAMGRTTPGYNPRLSKPMGDTVTQAMPGFSYHNYGLASDWDWFEEGQYSPLKLEDERWNEYMEACNKVGVRVFSFERPHNELDLPIRAKQLMDTFNDGGLAALDRLIKGET